MATDKQTVIDATPVARSAIEIRTQIEGGNATPAKRLSQVQVEVVVANRAIIAEGIANRRRAATRRRLLAEIALLTATNTPLSLAQADEKACDVEDLDVAIAEAA